MQLEKSKDTLELLERIWVGSIILVVFTRLMRTYTPSMSKLCHNVTTLITLSVRLDC